MVFENYKNPLLSERYRTIRDMLGEFENNPRVVLDIISTDFYEPDFGSKELNEEYINGLLRARSKKIVLDEDVAEYHEEFFKKHTGKGKPNTKGPYWDGPMWRVESVLYDNGYTSFAINGIVLYSSFEVAQKGPNSMVFRHPELKERFYKPEIDWVLPNPYGVSPILLLKHEGEIYVPFGERDKNVGIAPDSLGVIGGGMGTRDRKGIEQLIFKEIKEESPVGVFNLSDLDFLGTVYAGRNPNTLHLETATIVESSLNHNWKNYVSKEVKKGNVYLLNAPTKIIKGEPKEHKNVWLVRVHPDTIKDLVSIANGTIPNVGSFKWSEPHLVAYMLGADYALKNYF